MTELFTKDELSVAASVVLARPDLVSNRRLVGGLLEALSDKFQKHPVQALESVFISLRSPLRLLAVPMERVGREYIATLPHSGKDEYDFAVSTFDVREHNPLTFYFTRYTTSSQNFIDLGFAGVAHARQMRKPPESFSLLRN